MRGAELPREQSGRSPVRSDLIRRGLDAFARREIAAWLDCFDPDVQVLEDPAIPDAGSYRGHDGLMRWLHVMERNWDDFQVREKRMVESGCDVIALLTVHGRGRESGIEIDGQFGSVFTVEGGRVVKWQIFASWLDALSAAGVLEADVDGQGGRPAG
jgi:ketosteroid isomerase-like protein